MSFHLLLNAKGLIVSCLFLLKSLHFKPAQLSICLWCSVPNRFRWIEEVFGPWATETTAHGSPANSKRFKWRVCYVEPKSLQIFEIWVDPYDPFPSEGTCAAWSVNLYVVLCSFLDTPRRHSGGSARWMYSKPANFTSSLPFLGVKLHASTRFKAVSFWTKVASWDLPKHQPHIGRANIAMCNSSTMNVVQSQRHAGEEVITIWVINNGNQRWCEIMS